jgi:hypothetical protein
VLQTRWAMSYLRGPLTKPQIEKLMAERKASVERPSPAQPASEPLSAALDTTPAALPGYSDTPPSLDPAVSQVYLPLVLSEQEAVRHLAQEIGLGMQVQSVNLVYEPAILGGANVRFVDRRRRVNEQLEKVLLAPPPGEFGGVDWELAEPLPVRMGDLVRSRPPSSAERRALFAPAPEAANSERELRSIARSLADWLYYHSRLAITVHPELDLFQAPGEHEREFKIRTQQAARERRDAEVDALSAKYEARIEKLEARLRKEERELIDDEAEYDARRRETRLTMGETALSFFMGRRRTRTVSTIARKQRLADKAKRDIEESREEIAELEEEIAELERELQAAAKEITRKWADRLNDLTTEELHPRRTDVDVRLAAVAWLPSWLIRYDDGIQVHKATIAAYLSPKNRRLT